MNKKNGCGRYIRLALGAAALGAAAAGLWQLRHWAKDEYATALWIPCRGKGFRITKGEEPHTYQVQTGYIWNEAEEPGEPEDTEIEIRLPADDGEEPEQKDEA